LSLVPGNQPEPAPVADTRTRVANTNPVQTAPSGGGASGGYLVQVSSQRNEADAQASYRALQGKFPSVLGSRSPVIKRADLGDKGVYYRAMVGPFGSSDEASQFCSSLKTAGGQCVVQRN
jgi:cell division protein FtsN